MFLSQNSASIVWNLRDGDESMPVNRWRLPKEEFPVDKNSD
jgi:hypothetical protein